MDLDAFFRHNAWALPVLGISIGVGIYFIKTALAKTPVAEPEPPGPSLDNEYMFIELAPGEGANPYDLAALGVLIYEHLRRTVVESHGGSDDRAFVDEYLTKIEAEPSAISLGGGRSAKLRFTLPPDRTGRNHRERTRAALLASAAQNHDWMNHSLRVAGYEVSDETLSRIRDLASA